MTNVWEIITASNADKAHSAPYPVALPATAIRCYTSGEGDHIYDPFLGSGTTLIAADQLDRICYGLEIAPKYCDVIIHRFQDYAGKAASLDGDGRNFEEIAAGRMAAAA